MWDGMSESEHHSLRVSIVTVVLDRVTELEQNLCSVAEQDYPWREHIVIDGGSSDGSVDLLKCHEDQLAFWSSGPDEGIGDAMNKGVAKANGDMVLFLHADDRFSDGQALGRAMAKVGDARHIWAFDILFGEGEQKRRCSPRPFNLWTRFKNPLPHQGVLCPVGLFQQLGGFDPSFKICMDYEFWLRACLAGVRLRRVPQLLAVMNDTGISSRRDWKGMHARFSEERRVHLHHAGTGLWRWLYALYWPLYLGYRRLRLGLGS